MRLPTITNYHRYALEMVNRQECFDEVVTRLWDSLPHLVSHDRLEEIVREAYKISHGYYDDLGKDFYPSISIRSLDSKE